MKDWQLKLNKLFKIKSTSSSEIVKVFFESATSNIERWKGLDAGCGRESNLGKFCNQQSLVVGADIDEEALRSNKDISAGVVCSLEDLPFKRGIFDVINCQFVIEHLNNPTLVFKEFNTVLKPDGYLSLWTVNLLNYVTIVSKLTPTFIHNYYRKKFLAAKFDNVPTYYKANSIWKLDWMLRKQGFEKKGLILLGAAYMYLGFSKVTYFVSLLLNKFTDYGFLKYFRLLIMGLYKKR